MDKKQQNSLQQRILQTEIEHINNLITSDDLSPNALSIEGLNIYLSNVFKKYDDKLEPEQLVDAVISTTSRQYLALVYFASEYIGAVASSLFAAYSEDDKEALGESIRHVIANIEKAKNDSLTFSKKLDDFYPEDLESYIEREMSGKKVNDNE